MDRYGHSILIATLEKRCGRYLLISTSLGECYCNAFSLLPIYLLYFGSVLLWVWSRHALSQG